MAMPGSLRGRKKSIRAEWDLEWKLTSVVHGDGYKVVDRVKRQNLLVWVSRIPLEKNQEKSFRRYVSRLLSSSNLPIVTYGVDRQGIGYIALQLEGCAPLDSDKPTPLEVRYRFIECVAKVASLHERNIALENISLGSFVLDVDQEVVFVGFLGGFVISDLTAVPLDVRACLPLSSLNGLLSGQRADVYALAVLGLRLFGAQFPPSGINPDEVDQYLERIQNSAPRWVSQVLGPIIKQPQSSVFRDATDLLSALAEQERRAPPGASDSAPQETKGESKSTGKRRVSLEVLLSVQEIATRARLRDNSRKQPLLKRLARGTASQILAICLLVGIAIKAELIPLAWLNQILPWSSSSAASVPSEKPAVEAPKNAASGKDALSYTDILADFENISSEDEHSGLWRLVSKQLAEKGYHNTAAMTVATVDAGGGVLRQPAMLARVVEPDISIQERMHRLRSYEAAAPESAGRVAAAFALDDIKEAEAYRDFLISSVSRLISQSVSGQLSERSTSALIIALGGKNELSTPRNLELMRDIPPADLWWLVNVHAAKRSDKLALVIDGVLSRGLCGNFRAVFLKAARQAEISPETPYEALIHSAQHEPSVRDVTLFSEWLAPQSEQVLYAVLLTSTDPAVVTAALDGLRSKPQLDELIVAIVDVVRSHGDVNPAQHAPLIGSLGLRGTLDREAVIQGLQSARGLPLANLIAKKIFESGDPTVIGLALPVYGELIHPSFLMPLLQHPEPEVRLKTVPLLKNLPLASSRAELRRMYAAEEDARVRDAYEREGLLVD